MQRLDTDSLLVGHTHCFFVCSHIAHINTSANVHKWTNKPVIVSSHSGVCRLEY